jgi:hypothetical protein
VNTASRELAAMGYTNVAHYPEKGKHVDGSRIPGGEGCLEKRLGSHPGG